MERLNVEGPGLLAVRNRETTRCSIKTRNQQSEVSNGDILKKPHWAVATQDL